MFVKIGLCKGTSEKLKNNDFTEYYVLVSDEEQDEFGQMVEKTTGIRISKAQLDSGIRDVYDNLKGKQVCVPVYDRSWTSKDRTKSGVEKWLSRDGKPVPLVSAAQLKAAS